MIQQYLKKITLTIFAVIGIFTLGVASMPLQAEAQFVADVCQNGEYCLDFANLQLDNLNQEEVAALILQVAVLLVYLIGAVAVLAIIIGGILLIFGKSEQGWNIIKNTVFGLVICILSFTIVSLITNVLANL
jgi:type IV secretory pathway VirB2 component (pilin)